MNRIFLTFGVVGVLTYCMPTVQAKAINTGNYPASSYGVQPRTAGLIRKGNISASENNGKLCLNGSTIATGTMKSIGYTNIVIEYSSDNSNWYIENDNIPDLLKSESSSYYLNNYSISVNGGCYYRVTCNHYAKESGLFGSSQSVSNTSNSVWID